MHFVNESTKATTKEDERFLIEVCVMLKSLCFMVTKQRREDPLFESYTVECHSIARFISLFIKDLTLVDGVLLGYGLLPETKSVQMVRTDHSWLVTPDKSIIDPYPMGVISTTSALLIPTRDTQYLAHGANFYQKDKTVRDRFDAPRSWRKAHCMLNDLKKYSGQLDMEEICSDIV